jgi:hypothetical protein
VVVLATRFARELDRDYAAEHPAQQRRNRGCSEGKEYELRMRLAGGSAGTVRLWSRGIIVGGAWTSRLPVEAIGRAARVTGAIGARHCA